MNMIEVPANEQRDINVVTTEIRQLVNQYRRITVAFAVEIGRRLVEAKSLLPHGEWGKWLQEQVEFSQRTANNFMRVFEEYGDQQITLFGAVSNSQTFANLSVSKALSLLALPEDEREEFAEKHNVESMSTRQLNDAIIAKFDAERERDKALEQVSKLKKDLAEVDPQAVEAARSDAEAHKRLLQDAQKRVDELTAALEKARALAIKKAAEAKELKENPEIPADAAEKLRAEGAAAEAEKAKAELEKAKAAAEKAKQKAKAAAERAETLEKQLRTAAPELAAFREMFDQVQADIDRLRYSFEKVKTSQPEAAEKLTGALAALADKLKGW